MTILAKDRYVRVLAETSSTGRVGTVPNVIVGLASKIGERVGLSAGDPGMETGTSTVGRKPKSVFDSAKVVGAGVGVAVGSYVGVMATRYAYTFPVTSPIMSMEPSDVKENSPSIAPMSETAQLSSRFAVLAWCKMPVNSEK